MDELIKRIEALADPDPDSDWKYGKNFGIMLAVREIRKWGEQNESNNQEGGGRCQSD